MLHLYYNMENMKKRISKEKQMLDVVMQSY